MEIKGRVIKVFSEVFNLDDKQINLSDTKDNIESWDSIGHFQLVMSLEVEFGIKLTTEDIVEIDSVEKCLNKVIEYLNS